VQTSNIVVCHRRGLPKPPTSTNKKRAPTKTSGLVSSHTLLAAIATEVVLRKVSGDT
jgi:hypothetical protein